MFLKRIRVCVNGKRHTYWTLVKSIRTARGPRHQVVAYLGELRSAERVGWANVARIVDHRLEPHLPLFDTAKSSEPVPERTEVCIRGARVERTRDFGVVYPGLTLWRALKLDKLLERSIPSNREGIRWSVVGTILTLARFCEPSSPGAPGHIADTWYERTALDDLLGVPPRAILPTSPPLRARTSRTKVKMVVLTPCRDFPLRMVGQVWHFLRHGRAFDSSATGGLLLKRFGRRTIRHRSQRAPRARNSE